jgi:Zn-dependent peptidase ImmA (M78 family)/transcriptional regulator with XRE-family HTH domain
MATKSGGKEPFRKRAAEAREAMGFSIAEAANFLGFQNYQTLSSIEKGKRKITASELITMARLYGRDLDYFFEEEVQPDPKPLWRKTSDAELNINQAQRHFLSFLENYSNMENLLGLSRLWKDIQKNYDKTDFYRRGFKLADQLGVDTCASLDLGSRPAINLLNVLENNLRIKVLHLPLPNGISAACVVDDKLGVGILINANENFGRRNYDLAHELFHIITWNVFTHQEVGDGIKKTKPEKYADAFASSLLLPKAHVFGALEEITVNRQIRLIDIIELATDFGVSISALLWRLVNLNVIKKEIVPNLINDPIISEKTRLIQRKQYIKEKPSMFPERYVSIACRCLMEGKISRGVYAKYLNIDRSDIDRFLANRGFKGKGYEKIVASRR